MVANLGLAETSISWTGNVETPTTIEPLCLLGICTFKIHHLLHHSYSLFSLGPVMVISFQFKSIIYYP